MKIKYISEKNKKWNNEWKQIIEKQKRYKELDYKYKKQLELYEKKKECREIQELHNLYTKYIKELNNKPALILERKMENIITRVNHNLAKLNQKYNLPNRQWPCLYAQTWILPSRSETRKFINKRQRDQDIRFRTLKGDPFKATFHRLRVNQMVQSPGDTFEVHQL